MIFEDSELQEDSVIQKFRITAADGKSYLGRCSDDKIKKNDVTVAKNYLS